MPELPPEMAMLADAIALRVDRLRLDLPDDHRPPSPWLNSAEAAVYLGVTVKTLEAWRLAKAGPVFASRGRKIRRYHISKLDDWLTSGAGE